MNKVKYRSKDTYNEFLSAAKIISKKVSQIEGVVGILATGGIGRGHCDDYSDLDLIVYVVDRKVREIKKCIAVGNLRYKGIELDTPVESYHRALKHKSPSKYWSQVKRWDRENSKILFDTDDRIKNLLKEKLIFPDWEQKKLLKEHRQEVEGHLKYDFEMWEKRGDLINISDTLIWGTDHLILWIYAKNKKFQPYLPKWLFFYLENDFVPESRYFNIIKKPYMDPIRTIKQTKMIRDELLQLSEKIGIKFDYKDIEDLFAQHKNNWEKASKKTQYYLSW